MKSIVGIKKETSATEYKVVENICSKPYWHAVFSCQPGDFVIDSQLDLISMSSFASPYYLTQSDLHHFNLKSLCLQSL